MIDRILVLAPIAPSTLDLLRGDYDLIEAWDDPLNFLKSYPGAGEIKVVFTVGNRAQTRQMLDLLPALDYICHYGVGYDQIDVGAARRRGIRFTNTAGSNSACVADFAMLMLGASIRRLRNADHHVRSGAWANRRGVFAQTPQLAGRKVGIYGLGEIGDKVARRAAAFDMEIGYYSRSPRPDETHTHFASLFSLAEWADDLVIAVSATIDTIGSVDGTILRALGPDGYLINVARGSIVLEDDLISALKDGTIAGAGLDVFDGEPDIRPELRGLDNVLLSPHAAANTKGATEKTDEIFLANLRSYYSTRP